MIKMFLADSHIVKESNWLFPPYAMRSAGFVTIAEYAQDLGIQAQLEFTPNGNTSSYFSINCKLPYYFCLIVSSLKAGFISNALLCPVSRPLRAQHMVTPQ